MNIQELDILNILMDDPFINQRILAEKSRYSLGTVNKSLKSLVDNGYLDENYNILSKSIKLSHDNSPTNAVILAAGYGMRMVPINTETPKGLIEVKGEPLIERLIKQLNEVGITSIQIVVGFMKEQFEYLIDKYNVELIVNNEYSTRNNIYSLKLASKYLSNTYIIPCDLWCRENPFKRREFYSWYMVSEEVDEDSIVRVNRKHEIVETKGKIPGNSMLGISYLLKKDSDRVKQALKDVSNSHHFDGPWEEILFQKDKMFLNGRIMSKDQIVEINTYEQLRDLDSNSGHLNTEAIKIICEVFKVNQSEITDIKVLKKGMTNRSFLFQIKGKKYIMRIPGEGTGKLINRRDEAKVYELIHDKNICDEISYINPDTGYKISAFFEGARCADKDSQEDLKMAMDKLREFHNLKMKTDFEFKIFDKIDFYESLWEGKSSVYRDYKKTKENVFSLKKFIDKNVGEKILTHIDAVPDNFIFVDTDKGEEVKLIDWEYAAMCDPHVDIAMFCIYSLYNRKQCDNLIDIYFKNQCTKETRIKIYCYIAACGLLWSNWCEYKRNLGVEFGEYSLKQYRYAKDFYRLAVKEMEGLDE